MTELLVTNLATGYGDLKVVTDVSLAVRSNTVTAMLGRNGAGKTTTLRAIAGLNRITAGTVTLAGTVLNRLPAYRRARLGIAYVQEGKRVFRSRTVDENLQLGTFASRSRRRENKIIDEIYERFPMLAARRKTVASALSGGQQQMLAIAQALVAEPDILLLDEPSAGLAPTIVAELADIIRDLKARGLGILLVEQAVEFALAVADDVVVVDRGRRVHAAPVTDPGLRDAIRRAYLAEDASARSTAAGQSR
jgi:ABC-type branched-chain amino acid transport systems, ATPase component